MLAVRDYTLDFEEITSADQYVDLKIAENENGKTIMKYFKRRSGFVFPPPSGDHKLIHQLDTIPFTDPRLNELFISVFENLKQEVINNANPKWFFGKFLTGKEFATLMNYTVATIG